MPDEHEAFRELVWEACGYWDAINDVLAHLKVACDGRPLDINDFGRAILAMANGKYPKEKILADAKKFTVGRR